MSRCASNENRTGQTAANAPERFESSSTALEIPQCVLRIHRCCRSAPHDRKTILSASGREMDANSRDERDEDGHYQAIIRQIDSDRPCHRSGRRFARDAGRLHCRAGDDRNERRQRRHANVFRRLPFLRLRMRRHLRSKRRPFDLGDRRSRTTSRARGSTASRAITLRRSSTGKTV